MQVIKRDGSRELVKYDKITTRIRKQTYGLNTDYVDALEVAKKVIQGVHDGVTTVELDSLAAETAASMTSIHPDYSTLASRIAITSLHKSTKKSFFDTIKALYEYIDPKTGENAGMISEEVFKFIEKNKATIEETINYDRDFNYDYFGYKTLERSYLLKIDGEPAERPQHMLMRVACGIWYNNIKEAIETYELLSQGMFTHATPTLFNAGTKRPQLSSCFLLMMNDDSLEGIYKTLSDCAMISKNAGGLGVHIHNVRGKGSYIKGTNGTSNGIIPMLRVYNETARYVDQCFSEDTKVLTPDGTKRIADILPGDVVLSTSGPNVVMKNSRFENKQLFNIKTSNGMIKVTGEHLFLVIKNGKLLENIKASLKNKTAKPQWIEAKNLSKNDLLVEYIPKIKEEECRLKNFSMETSQDLKNDGCI